MTSHSTVFHSVTAWTVAYQALLSMEFSRQEDCNGLPFPTPGDLPNLGIKPMSPALAGGFFTTRSTWENISSVQFRLSVVSGSLRPHRLQYITFPCPSPTPRVYSNSCRLSRWCHPTISSSVIPFSSCLWSFLASRSFPTSLFFESGGQSIGVSPSTSVLPKNTQDWSPLGWTGWISLQSKKFSRVFSNTTVQKHQFFGAQLSL